MNDNDEPESAVDTYVTPSTPIGQSGTFGAIEPADTTVSDNFTIPVTDPKWNQVVEVELPEDKKVDFFRNMILLGDIHRYFCSP